MASRCGGEPLLAVRGLRKYFPVREGVWPLARTRYVRAVDGVDFEVCEGEVYALVGESGSGKTTIAKLIVGLLEPDEGQILYRGVDLARLPWRRRRLYAREIQLVMQTPWTSLNPRMRVFDIVAEAVKAFNKGLSRDEVVERVYRLLELVQLPAETAQRYPHELSGGQAQRVALARALAPNPSLLVLDEPTSALDVSIQAHIVNLLLELRERLGLTYILITHDLGVVSYMADHVAVMYMGRIVEEAPAEKLFEEPLHPYTRALIAAVPEPDPSKKLEWDKLVIGEPPSALNPPKGCHYHPRCPHAMQVCKREPPPVLELGGRRVSCWLYTTRKHQG